MYKDIFESIRNEAEKRNLRERTIQLYCSDVSYFLRWIGKNVSDLTLEDAESFLTAKRLEGRSPETHNHYRSAIKFLYKKVLKTVWDDDTVPAMKSAKLAGINRHVSSHACRHSFASHLFESGTDIKYIQSLLGHVDPRSTDVYLHVSNKTLLGIRSPFDNPEGGES